MEQVACPVRVPKNPRLKSRAGEISVYLACLGALEVTDHFTSDPLTLQLFLTRLFNLCPRALTQAKKHKLWSRDHGQSKGL